MTSLKIALTVASAVSLALAIALLVIDRIVNPRNAHLPIDQTNLKLSRQLQRKLMRESMNRWNRAFWFFDEQDHPWRTIVTVGVLMVVGLALLLVSFALPTTP